MFDFGQPQAPLPSDGMTFGEKMRKEVADYKKQKREENVKQAIEGNTQYIDEFKEVVSVLHATNPSESSFVLIQHTESNILLVKDLISGVQGSVSIYELVYEHDDINCFAISGKLFDFLKYNAHAIRDYLDLAYVEYNPDDDHSGTGIFLDAGLKVIADTIEIRI